MSSSTCKWTERLFFALYNYHLSEPISMLHGQSRGSLDDIMLEDDTDLHKELDDFFGSEAEVS